MCSAFKNEVIALTLFSAIIFPAYAFMNYSNIPLTANTCAYDISDLNNYMDPFVPATQVVTPLDSICNRKEVDIEIRINFCVFMIGIMAVIGWVFLVFFLPTGMQAYPFDLIAQWYFRPRPMDPKEFDTKKQALSKTVSQLMQQGKSLHDEKKKFIDTEHKLGCFGRYRQKKVMQQK